MLDINYENLHAFLCNECGYCKYGKFEYSLAVKPSYAADKIESEEGTSDVVPLLVFLFMYFHCRPQEDSTNN